MSPHLERAYLLYEQRRYAMAETEAGQALLEAPNDARTLSLLALCLLEQEKFEEATQRAQEAILNAPDSGFGHYAMARVWTERNYLDRAEESIRAAIALAPDAPEYRVALASLYYRRSQWAQALTAAEEALALDPDHGVAVGLRAEALRKLGRKDAARDHLEEQLSRDPEDPYVHATLGWNYLEKGNRDAAMRHFREALRLEPDLEWACEGVIETLKTKSGFYRGMLRYFFWISRFPPRVQFALVIGMLLLVQFIAGVLSTRPELLPVLIVVALVYSVFVLSSWFASPLANLALTLHPFGRLALSRDERFSAVCVGAALVIAIGGVVAALGTLTPLYIGGHVASAAFTVACTFAVPAPWPRRGMLYYSALVLAAAALSLGMQWLAMSIESPSPAFERFFYIAWPPVKFLLGWNVLISTLLPGLLVQYRPKRG